LVERLIRNQQVAGSIPAGGSSKSISYKLGFFFNNSTATLTLSVTDLM
jgi:hypothetical protein